MGSNGRGEFTGKVAFVTGAASGIGREATLAFGREGARVVVADVSESGSVFVLADRRSGNAGRLQPRV